MYHTYSRHLLCIAIALLAGCSEEPDPAPPPVISQLDTPPPAQTSAALFAEGRALQARAHFKRAEEVYRQAITLEPNSAQYHYYLGTVLHATSRYADARSYFEKALALKKDYAAPHIALGKLLYDIEGDATNARRLLETALELAPQAHEARFTLAIIHQREGELDEATRLFTQLVEADSSNSQARAQLGLVHLQAGRIEEAQNELRKAARALPYYSPIYLGLGQSYLRQGQTEIGQRLLERARQLEEETSQLKPHQDALRQSPDTPQAHYNLASLYSRFGRLRNSAEHYSRAIALDSTYALAYQGLGNLYQRLGTTPEARTSYAGRAHALYLRALDFNPTLAESHNNLGLLLHGSGDVESAVKHYAKAAEIDQQTGFYQANLSRAHFDLKEMDKARQAAKRALAINPSLSAARETLGDIYAAAGHFQKALEQWQSIPGENASPPLKKKIEDARKHITH
jgi:tetratricopeptide (TPR) repeat protein